VPGIVGLGIAAELARAGLADFDLRIRSLRDRLETRLRERIPRASINGTTLSRTPHTTNLSFQGVEGEALLISLDLQGIAVSTGAACSSGSLEPSHVLKAMGFANRRVESALRLSLSRMTTEEEIETVLELLPRTVRRMRELSPLYREGRGRVQREGQRAHS
jgi:cysteine desulfurase